MKKLIILMISLFLFTGCSSTYDRTETMMMGTGVGAISGMLLLSGPGSVIVGSTIGGLTGYTYYEIKKEERRE
jgi:uncharacterized protein YceK